MINEDTPLWRLTVSEFMQLMGKPTEKQEQTTTSEKWIVHGISGIMEVFNCSRATAQRIKNSGKIDKAIVQVGRKITIDADLAMELLKK